MADVTEQEVYSALLAYAGKSGPITVGKSTFEVELQPQDTHVRDSPDCVLWLQIRGRIFEQQVQIRVPIPIEAEKTGLTDALQDLDKFVARGRYPLEIPMLVVSGTGFSTSQRDGHLPVVFSVRQLPVGIIR